MALYDLNDNSFQIINETTFAEAVIKERNDLQRLLRKQIEIISPDTLVIAEEFGDWDDSRRRIDLLGIDKNANLVVIELKRTDDGGHMELQAIRYSAMVSTMTFDKAVNAYTDYLANIGSELDPRESLLDFLGWTESDDDNFAQDVRVVLASADFSKELTTTVMWLNKRDLDIRCVRMKPYRYGDKTVVDVQQVIPLPEAAEYEIQIREKEQKEKTDRLAGNTVFSHFWGKLLHHAQSKTDLHTSASPNNDQYLPSKYRIRGLKLIYVIKKDAAAVELYIYGRTKNESKSTFDQLHEFKTQVEDTFGESLDWQRLESTHASRVRYDIYGGGYGDESQWDDTIELMVDKMIDLEQALRPHVEKLTIQ